VLSKDVKVSPITQSLLLTVSSGILSILIWGAVLSMIFLDITFSSIQISGIILMLMAILLVQYKKGKMIIKQRN